MRISSAEFQLIRVTVHILIPGLKGLRYRGYDSMFVLLFCNWEPVFATDATTKMFTELRNQVNDLKT